MPARRDLTLFEAVVWVYRDQHAHKHLRTTEQWWKFLVDAGEWLGPQDSRRPVVDRDAAAIHGCVLELGDLGQPVAYYALLAEPPRPWDHSIQPRPRHVDVDRRDDLYCRATIDGALTDVKIAIAERVSERVPIFRRVSRRKAVIAGYRHEVTEVQYCPVVYEPAPEWITAVDGIYDTWRTAMAALGRSLASVRLSSHTITDLGDYLDAIAAE
jgi:hypothetical protein